MHKHLISKVILNVQIILLLIFNIMSSEQKQQTWKYEKIVTNRNAK